MPENTDCVEKESGGNRGKTSEGTESGVSRRDALKMSATAAAVGLTGISAMTGSAAATERQGISFDRVVNAVDDLGLDPDGDEPIDSAIEETIEEGDYLIEFPPGTYYWEDTVDESDVNNWGIRGLGDDPTDVRFVSEDGAGKFLLKTNGGEGILVENVAIDYGFDREGSLGLMLKADDGLRVQDLHFVGFKPTQGEGAVENLSPQALDSDGQAIVDGLVCTGPTDIAPHGHLDGDVNTSCVWLGERHVGELLVRNSHIENAGTNAIYARESAGDVKIEDSLFVNNNQTALRIGGSGSYVKGCRFVVDTDNATEENDGEFINPHAVTWETGERGETGGYIEDCDFVYESAPAKTAAAVWIDGSAGEMAIRDSRFRMDADGVAAIRADDPRDPRLGDTASKPWGVTLENVSITGSSSGSHPAVFVNNRDGSAIRDCCLQLTGNRDGIYLRNSDDSVVENTNVNVEGEATTFAGSDVSTEDISHSDSCPVPDDSFSIDDETETETPTDDETETETPTDDESESETPTDDESESETETEASTETETETEPETPTKTETETDDE
ncbi:right-handed parallel beta-helix repeat-containing protein [Halopelagius longus]|uniref:right-handed parallel beta-helix repeat-containing protein n=1 Tax=Halopelagius longus TaxID=1236180 RepID=UPI001C68D207|nr:right-handed parallel beta-helix repeat-containing protein [Halopelagius longus]